MQGLKFKMETTTGPSEQLNHIKVAHNHPQDITSEVYLMQTQGTIILPW